MHLETMFFIVMTSAAQMFPLSVLELALLQMPLYLPVFQLTPQILLLMRNMVTDMKMEQLLYLLEVMYAAKEMAAVLPEKSGHHGCIQKKLNVVLVIHFWKRILLEKTHAVVILKTLYVVLTLLIMYANLLQTHIAAQLEKHIA